MKKLYSILVLLLFSVQTMKTKLLLSIFISIIMISCNKEENSTFNIVQESRAIEQQENPFNDSLILMPYNSVIDSLFQLDEYNEYYNYSNRSCSNCDSIPGCYVFSIPSLYFDDDVLVIMATSTELLGMYNLYFNYQGHNYQWFYDHNEQIEASMYTKDGLLIASFLIFPRSNYIAFEYINETLFNNGNKSMSVEGVLCNLLGAYAGRVWIQAIITFAGPIGGWGLIALHIGVTLLNYYACSDL